MHDPLHPRGASMNEDDRANAERFLSELDERGRRVLSLRFALDGQPQPRTLKEVAELLGCSEEAVREEEAAAMATVRARMRGADG